MPRKPREPRVPKAERIRRKALGPDGNIHVPKIMTADPMIFPPRLRLALQHYLDTEPRDAGKAAYRAGMDPEEFKKHMHSPGVRQWVRDQENLIFEKSAELRAKARMLTEDHLDAATLTVLNSRATPPNAKVRMIEVGYRRFGMLKDKVEATGAGGAPLAFELIRIGTKKDADAGR